MTHLQSCESWPNLIYHVAMTRWNINKYLSGYVSLGVRFLRKFCVTSPCLIRELPSLSWLDNWWQISSDSWLVWNAFSLLYLVSSWELIFQHLYEHRKAIQHRRNSINLKWNNECRNKYFIKRLVAVSYQLFYDVAWKFGQHKKLIIYILTNVKT